MPADVIFYDRHLEGTKSIEYPFTGSLEKAHRTFNENLIFFVAGLRLWHVLFQLARTEKDLVSTDYKIGSSVHRRKVCAAAF